MEVAGVEYQPIMVNIRRAVARQPELTIPLEQTPEYKAALRTLVASVPISDIESRRMDEDIGRSRDFVWRIRHGSQTAPVSSARSTSAL